VATTAPALHHRLLPRFRTFVPLVGLLLATGGPGWAQSDADRIAPILAEEILAPGAATLQLKQFLLRNVAAPPKATSASEWTTEASRLREHLLRDVVFHGWPSEWVTAAPKFEDLGLIATGKGYRLRKLRYEIVPGFESVALLYEPEKMEGRLPAVVNVNGHVGPPGKSVEYKQKRCINLARNGILALNLEWLSFGELGHPENAHWFGAHLDLVGANALGLFYLEMRKGLDYLASHPRVDPKRLGVTGLSGGGWQTIVLSALDERVAVSVPVAGYSSTATKVEARRFGDLGDLEQNGPDLLDGSDYPHLTALRAPRPTLLVYNAEDDCCFRGPLVEPLVFQAVKPIFKLYGKEADFAYHENRDPATHNYQLDNRLAAYRFFSRHFGLPAIEGEPGVAEEVKTYDELLVGLRKDNQTILGLARQMSHGLNRTVLPRDDGARPAWIASQRERLKHVVRYAPAEIGRAWTVANTKNKGVETRSHLFEMAGGGERGGQRGLNIDGVWLKAIDAPANAPAALVLHDKGKKVAAGDVEARVNRGEQVLALDLLFTGDAWKSEDGPHAYAQIVDGQGNRTLGLQAAQLVAVAKWLRARSAVPKVRVEVTGIRNQVAAQVAAAIEPDLFSEVRVREGMQSLAYLLDTPVRFQDAPELFCLDLYKELDLDQFADLASPARVVIESHVRAPEPD
jgi:dienelactone hydrolase